MSQVIRSVRDRIVEQLYRKGEKISLEAMIFFLDNVNLLNFLGRGLKKIRELHGQLPDEENFWPVEIRLTNASKDLNKNDGPLIKNLIVIIESFRFESVINPNLKAHIKVSNNCVFQSLEFSSNPIRDEHLYSYCFHKKEVVKIIKELGHPNKVVPAQFAKAICDLLIFTSQLIENEYYNEIMAKLNMIVYMEENWTHRIKISSVLSRSQFIKLCGN